MKKLNKILFLLLCMSFFFMPMSVKAQEKFDIDSYSIEIDVHEDGSLDIHEKIDMTFTSYVHGFYRNIPIKYNMDWGEMGKKTYYFPISDIEVLNDPYEVETDSEGVQIKIGDPDQYVYGPKSYDIFYHVQTRNLGIDQDYFYYNLIGQFDCRIESVEFKITFPSSIDTSTLRIYGQDDIMLISENNVIFGKTTHSLNNYQSLTMYLELGENYFNFVPIADHTNAAMILSGFVLVFSFLLYLKFGKKQAPVITVEFNAPEGLSSAGVGYVIDGTVNTEDVLSLIIDFADRGYLTIHDTETDTIIRKKKDLDETCNFFEKTFFNALFNGAEEVTITELQNRHFGDQIQIAKEQIFNHFHLKENKIYSNGSLTIQIILCILSGLAGGIISACSYYHLVGMVEVASLPLFILWPLISATMIFWIILSRKHHVYSKTKKFGKGLFALICNLIAVSISLFFLKDNMIAFLFVLIYTFIMVIMIGTSGKRSEIGNRWLGQILGLKQFILEAEIEQLEMLVEEDPSYFYHILPYAYVLGISDTWSKKFEKINISSPDWYSSYDQSAFSTLFWMSHFNSTMNSFSSLSSAITPPSSGDGGFSSGGGGFSGGGFGGGGGGSW